MTDRKESRPFGAVVKVRRIVTENGSHVEPPLDDSWDHYKKLRWQAAVVSLDTGLTVHVYPTEQKTLRRGWFRENPGMYDVVIPDRRAGMFTFMEAWAYLNGVKAGRELGT